MTDAAIDQGDRASWLTETDHYYYIPPVFEPFLAKPKRIKVAWGGRGAGKSVSVAEMIIILMMSRMPINGQPFRVLCGREFQNTIAESSAFEMENAYKRFGWQQWFKSTGAQIRCRRTGAQVLFRGVHNNIDQIKSYGGIDLFWGEEAHSFTMDSLIYLEPTIRRDAPFGPCGQGSELWFTMNQHLDTDPIFTRYKLAQSAYEDDDVLSIPCTYKDNPFFPDVLEKQRAKSEREDPRDHYEWVWGTQCRNLGGIFFALENMLVGGQPIEWPRLCDSVFAVIDTATKTGNEHDATAVVYFAYSSFGAHIPLVMLDYDLVQIEGSLLEQWVPSVDQTLQRMAHECKARFGSSGIFIEDKSSGSILLSQAARRGIKVAPIDSKMTAMGKTERAIAVSGHIWRGMLKVSKPCFDKVVTFKGVTLNHLMSQIKAFRIGDEDARDKPDDALDCAVYGVMIALGKAEDIQKSK